MRCSEFIYILGSKSRCVEPSTAGRTKCKFHSAAWDTHRDSDDRWNFRIDHNYHVDNQGDVIQDLEAVDLSGDNTKPTTSSPPDEDDYSEESSP